MKNNIGINLIPFQSFSGSGNIIPFYIEGLLEADTNNNYFIFYNNDSQDIAKRISSLKIKYKNVITKSIIFPRIKFSLFIFQQIAIPYYFFVFRLKKMFTPTFAPIFFLFRNNVVIYYDAALHFFRKEDGYSRFSSILFDIFVVYCKLFSVKVLTLSDYSKEEYAKLFSVPFFNSNSVKLISCALPVSASVSLRSEDMTSKFGWKNSYFFYIGTALYHKNVANMIQAFLNFISTREDKNICFVLAGAQFTREKFDAKFPEYRESKEIIPIGVITEEEKKIIIRNSAAMFFVSYYEGFGLPILEAQTYGVPVITSNASSMPEVAGHGAVLVDPNSIEEMSLSLARVLDDLQFRDEVISEGRKNIDNYSWARCANLILNNLR